MASFLVETVQSLRERVESAVQNSTLRELWLKTMLEKVGETWYPSKQMLARIARYAAP